MSDETPSPEELQLRRHECDDRGHTYDVLGAVTANVPVEVVCTRCGESWKIRDDEPKAERPEHPDPTYGAT